MVDEELDLAALVREACHDLRTPLATAYGFARTLERLGGLDDKQARHLSFVVAGCEDLGRLIDAVAVVARIEQGAFEPRLRTADLAHVAAAAAAEADARGGPERGALFEADGSRIEVETDVDRATAALAGLAEAALRLQPGVDQVVVTAGPGPQVTIGPASGEALEHLLVVGRDIRLAAAHGALRLLGARVEAGDGVVVVRFA